MFFYKPVEPPPEVKDLRKCTPLPNGSFGGWYNTPTLNPTQKRLSTKELLDNAVHPLEVLGDLFRHKIITRSLATFDVGVGCGHQCHVCLAAATQLSSIFSYSGIVDAFRDNRFLQIISKKGLRCGSSGDILDHPQGVEIAQTMVGKVPFLKIFTNYRPNLRDELDALISLARAHPDNFRLTISIPVMMTPTIRDSFMEYASKRKEIFSYLTYDHSYESKIENVGVQDVPRQGMWSIGRVPTEVSLKRMHVRLIEEGNRTLHYEDRGLVKTYFNPDALWLFIYATMKESNTARVFTPLNVENIEHFSYLPYHPHFPTPPNWHGGKGVRRGSIEAKAVKHQARWKRDKAKDIV